MFFRSHSPIQNFMFFYFCYYPPKRLKPTNLSNFVTASLPTKLRAKESSLRYQKSLNVAVLGAPNAGKSTLVNCLVGGKVTAVSPKRNTTRSSLLGILTSKEKKTQIVFYDTPGFVDYRDSKSFVRELYVTARDTVEMVDVAVLVFDAARRFDEKSSRNLQALINRCLLTSCPLILAMNKVDLVNPKTKLLELATQLHGELVKNEQKIKLAQKAEGSKQSEGDEVEASTFTLKDTEFFMISAKNNDGVDTLKEHLFKLAKAREWDFDSKDITDLDKDEQISEIIREKLYCKYHKELPYIIEQGTSSTQKRPDGTLCIEQFLFVSSESHKKIIQGNNGNTLKAVIHSVEHEIKKQLNVNAKVALFVKYKKIKS